MARKCQEENTSDFHCRLSPRLSSESDKVWMGHLERGTEISGSGWDHRRCSVEEKAG